MVPDPQTLKETVGLFLGQAAARDRRTQVRRRMPDADIPEHVVELAWLAGRAESLGFVVGQPTGIDHLVETPHEAIAALPGQLVLTAFVHRAERIDTRCRCQGVLYMLGP